MRKQRARIGESILLIIGLMFGWGISICQAQPKLYQSTTHPPFLLPGQNDAFTGDTLRDPFGGGVLQAQISHIDLDGNGRPDFFIFEPLDGKVLPYLNVGYDNFVYAPEYEIFFPRMKNWALARDFNNDGKADLFCFSSQTAGIDVYLNRGIVNGGPSFQKIVTRLSYDNAGGKTNIYSGTADIPLIEDLNGDGRADLLIMDIFQARALLFLNTSKELGLPADSLRFKLADYCYGKFETTFEDTMLLKKGCGYQGPRGGAHGSTSLMALDLDGDGDKDLVVSNLFYDAPVTLINGKKEFGHITDSMVRQERGWPGGGNTLQIPNYPVLFPIDYNNDGKTDIVASPQAVNESIDRDNIWLYTNVGSNDKPVFALTSKNYLINSSIREGRRSSPCFWDYNSDGYPDLLIASKGNEGRFYQADKFSIWINTPGKNGERVYVRSEATFPEFNNRLRFQMNAAAADLDGDGKPDLLVGEYNGSVTAWRNVSLSGPQLQEDTTLSEGLRVSMGAAPCLFDVDGDGLTDALIGGAGGTIAYFRNEGNAAKPKWTKITDSFANIHVNDSFWVYSYDPNTGAVIDSTKQKQAYGFAAPAVADVDGDGKPDLICGTAGGRLFWYSDLRKGISAPLPRQSKLIYNGLAHKYEDKKLGTLVVPAFGDLNGDSIPEMIVGSYRGGLSLFGSIYKPVTVSVPSSPRSLSPTLSVYPNPASEWLYIKGLPAHCQVSLSDATGRTVVQFNHAASAPAQLNVSKLASGVYIIRAQNGNTCATARFIRP